MTNSEYFIKHIPIIQKFVDRIPELTEIMDEDMELRRLLFKFKECRDELIAHFHDEVLKDYIE